MSDLPKPDPRGDIKVRARARVQITIELTLPGHWGGQDSFAHVHKDARNTARDAIMSGVSLDGLVMNGRGGLPARIIGEPIVTMILTDEEK